MSSTNAWLKGQRKSDLVELAQSVGLKDYEGLKKSDLEVQLDEFLGENSTQYASDTRLAPYYASRARSAGSPVKGDVKAASRRRAAKLAEEATEADEDEDEQQQQQQPTAAAASSAGNALARTPGRALSLASRIPLPATPAEVVEAVDRGTLAVRQRVASLYTESGVAEATAATRESLSTVPAVLLAVAAFELWRLRPEVLADRYAFTIPAVSALGTPDYPVHVPDAFLLLTSSFWSPALTWALTAFIVPALVGYFFNLSAATSSSATGGYGGRGRPSRAAVAAASQAEYTVDPLTFSIAKAVLTFVVYGQRITFGGWLDDVSISRIDGAMFNGWKGVVAGCAITGLVSIYDAVLRK